MSREGLARSILNTRVRRIILVFEWAVSEEIVPPRIHHGLKSVSGLQGAGLGPRKRSPSARPLKQQSRRSGPTSSASSGPWSRFRG
jgi:hypothetical protein